MSEQFDTRSSSPGEYGNLRVASATIGHTDTTVEVDTLAVGDIIISVWMDLLDAFDAGTANVVELGTEADADRFGSNDLTGTTVPGPDEPAIPLVSAPCRAIATEATLRLAFTQTGTAATAGEVRAYAMISSMPR